MKKYQRKTMANPQGIYYKKRIAKNRRRAKNVGLLYLLAIIAFAVLACLPLCKNALASVGVMEFYKVFTKANIKDWKTAETFVKLATGGLYALMLLGVVINVFRALGKLRWLHKKTAHREYGFNRNVYAMEDLGRIFSGSFAVILTTYFLISVLCGAFSPEVLLYAVLGVGVLFRLFCGVWGAKVAYFDVNEGKITEEPRKVGRFAPFFRNLLQLASVLGMIFFFVKATTLDTEIPALLQSGGISKLTDNMENLISVMLQALVVLCSFVLIKHATAITEYNHEGAHGVGMKNFRVFSFFVALTAAGATAVPYLMDKANYKLDTNMLIVAGVAFAMFLLELIMRKHPKLPEDKKKAPKEKPVDDSELHFENLSFTEPAQPMSKKELKAQQKAQADAPTQVPVRPAPMVMPVPPTQAANNNMVAPMPMPAQVRTYPQPQPYPYVVPQPYPVYQPMPVPYQTPVNVVCQHPTPAPAAAPAPAPTPVAAPVTVKKEEKEPEEKVVSTDNMQKVENGKAELNCPHCSARLRVDSNAEYHRCPVCRKVFQLRKVQK